MRYEGTNFKNTSLEDLSERISVIYFETERNTRGDIVKTEELIRCMVWAQVKPLTGKITDSAPVKTNEVTYRITIRHRADIKPDDEIIWRGKRLKITTPPIDINSQHIWTSFDCKEAIQDGTQG